MCGCNDCCQKQGHAVISLFNNAELMRERRPEVQRVIMSWVRACEDRQTTAQPSPVLPSSPHSPNTHTHTPTPTLWLHCFCSWGLARAGAQLCKTPWRLRSEEHHSADTWSQRRRQSGCVQICWLQIVFQLLSSKWIIPQLVTINRDQSMFLNM